MQIISTGFVPNGTVPLRATAKVQVDIQRGSPFQVGLFGLDLVELARTQVDSYDSTGGVSYDPLNPGTEGHIHSNKDFKFWSDNIVNGDVHLVGPSIIESGANNTINGTTQTGVASINVVTDVSYPVCTGDTGISPAGAYNYSASCDLTVLAGATVTLDQGTHSFNKITMEAGSSLAVTGPVEIYMTGQFYAHDGVVVNTSGNPTNLMIFSNYAGVNPQNDDAVYFDNGSGEFYGGIYALNGEVEFQNDPAAVPVGWQIYGAIVALHIDLEEYVGFHYDLALAQSRSPAGKFRPTAGTWREVF